MHAFTTLIEGKRAILISHAQFNKEASVKYSQLTHEERKDLEQEVERMDNQHMTKQDIRKRAQQISNRIQTLVCHNHH